MRHPRSLAGPRPPLRRRPAGFSMIEVLVAILIFSFGLLGFVGLQSRAIQYAVSAEDSGRAALLANEMAAAMEGNQSLNPTADALAAWQARVTAQLPNGQGTITYPGGAIASATITITWQATSAIASAPNSVNRYVTEVLLPS